MDKEREMAENDLNLDDIDLDQYEDPITVGRIRDYGKQQEKLAREGQAAIAELSMMKAGVDMSTKAGQLLLKSYGTKVPSVDVIKAEWEEVKPATATAPPATPTAETPPETTPSPSEPPVTATPTTPESTGSQERRDLSTGAPPTGTPTGNKRQELVEMATHAAQQGDWEHAAGGLIHGIIEGYEAGEVEPLSRTGRRQGE